MPVQLFVYDTPEQIPVSENTYFASREGEGFWLERTKSSRTRSKTLPLLWEDASGSAPEAIPESLWREEVLQKVKEYKLLGAVGGRSAEELLTALRRLDSEDVDLEGENAIEEEIQLLRDSLRAEGIFSEEARRRVIAQSPQALGDLSLAFIPTPSRQMGKLVHNLGKSSTIQIHALLSSAMIDPYIRMLGCEATIFDQTSGRVMPFGEPGEADREIRMIHGNISPSCDAVASPSPLSDWRSIWPLFKEHSQELLFRTDVAVRDTLLGSQLLEENSWQEICDAKAAQGMSENELLWLQSLQKEREYFQGESDVRRFLDGVFAERKWRGTGPPLLFPGEVPAFAPKRLLFWGLETNRYPRSPAPSLFFSEALLLRHPELGTKDQRPAFVSALLAAKESITLFRNDIASSFWLEAQRVWQKDEEVGCGLPPRQQARLQARQNVRTPRLDDLRIKMQRDDPEPPAGRRYSVTELESYLRCPLGWFVQYRLRPQRSTPEMEEGTLLHSFLEEANALEADAALEKLEQMPTQWRDPLREVLNKYINNWPATERHSEVSLEVSLDLDGEEVELRGRADRVDVFDDGILLLDWKRGRAPNFENSLQAALYPWMAAERFQKEPLGFLFVSLQQGASSGILARRVAELDLPLGWTSWSRRATSKAEEAIRGIESGKWQERGERCPSWCPHYFYSRTAAHA